mmetsp:Transcript_5829/g.19809  ORF Transcript_5829/g.19809 Transcript_5829/m.19809 type:complete len:202 (+) Transcript_5829:2396-3001(+)
MQESRCEDHHRPEVPDLRDLRDLVALGVPSPGCDHHAGPARPGRGAAFEGEDGAVPLDRRGGGEARPARDGLRTVHLDVTGHSENFGPKVDLVAKGPLRGVALPKEGDGGTCAAWRRLAPTHKEVPRLPHHNVRRPQLDVCSVLEREVALDLDEAEAGRGDVDNQVPAPRNGEVVEVPRRVPVLVDWLARDRVDPRGRVRK